MSEYYKIIVDVGHEIAASTRNLGALSSNTFNAARNLGRVDLLSADDEIAKLLAQSRLKGVIIGVVATGGIIAVATGGVIAAVKSAPYIKGWFNGLTSKSSGNAEMSEGESQPALDGAAATTFSQQVEAALDDLPTEMSSEEAQRRLAMIMIAAAFIADQIRVLSRARVEDAGAPQELKSALERLSSLVLQRHLALALPVALLGGRRQRASSMVCGGSCSRSLTKCKSVGAVGRSSASG